MSEQQTASACPHPEAVGTRWGDPISAERQAELEGYLDRWGGGDGPRRAQGAVRCWRSPFDERTGVAVQAHRS
jgi:hypothetical protein